MFIVFIVMIVSWMFTYVNICQIIHNMCSLIFVYYTTCIIKGEILYYYSKQKSVIHLPQLAWN